MSDENKKPYLEAAEKDKDRFVCRICIYLYKFGMLTTSHMRSGYALLMSATYSIYTFNEIPILAKSLYNNKSIRLFLQVQNRDERVQYKTGKLLMRWHRSIFIDMICLRRNLRTPNRTWAHRRRKRRSKFQIQAIKLWNHLIQYRWRIQRMDPRTQEPYWRAKW